MKKDIIFLIIVVIIVIGAIGTYLYNRENIEEIDPINWCIPGTNLTIPTEETVPIEDQNITDEINFQVINLTTYKGKEVCHAEYTNEEGTLIQYFTKKHDFVDFVYKNSYGNITNEIELNQTSFETNYEDMNYDDTNYEENYN